MKLHHLLIASLLSLPLAACSSEPVETPDATTQKRPAPYKAQRRPDSTLAPVGQWDRDFAGQLPAPWRFDRDALEIQVEAPENWTRIAGDRGLKLWFTDGVDRHPVWVFPQGFEGKTTATPAATFHGENGEFVLYTPSLPATGWTHDALVLTVLEMHPVQ